MSKKVEIYNAYFGDCIVLKDEDDDSNLLVDFGVHYFSKVAKKYGSRECLLEEIENGIIKSYSNKNISLLITHINFMFLLEGHSAPDHATLANVLFRIVENQRLRK